MYSVQIIPEEKLGDIIPLLRLLNPGTDDAILSQRLNDMKAYNYHCIGVCDEQQLVGICGFWILCKHYIGKHIEPDNVVILPEYRNKQLGELMMQWIEEYAVKEGCVALELNCYIGNQKGLKFWFRRGYTMLGFHLRKNLDK